MSEIDHPDIYRSVLEQLQTGVCLVDRDRRIVLWSDGAERITGHLRQDVIGRFCPNSILIHSDESNNVLCTAACPMLDAMRDGKPRQAEVYLLHRAGYPIPVRVRSGPIRNNHGTIIGAVETFDDATFDPLRERRGNTLRQHGWTDEVTGFPDHEYMRLRLQVDLAAFQEFHIPFSILCADVDRMDHLRECYGAHAADAILRVVAQTLRNSLRATDLVGRWNGNQFLVIAANCRSDGVGKAAENLRKWVSCSAIQWWGDHLSLTISLGGTTVATEDTIDSILERTENLVKQSQSKGGDCVTVS